jgi:hypothetical protein
VFDNEQSFAPVKKCLNLDYLKTIDGLARAGYNVT